MGHEQDIPRSGGQVGTVLLRQPFLAGLPRANRKARLLSRPVPDMSTPSSPYLQGLHRIASSHAQARRGILQPPDVPESRAHDGMLASKNPRSGCPADLTCLFSSPTAGGRKAYRGLTAAAPGGGTRIPPKERGMPASRTGNPRALKNRTGRMAGICRRSYPGPLRSRRFAAGGTFSHQDHEFRRKPGLSCAGPYSFQGPGR